MIHEYLSTACLHGQHDYCAAMVGVQGQKRPATCKFCDARCTCPCHMSSPTVIEPAVDLTTARAHRPMDGDLPLVAVCAEDGEDWPCRWIRAARAEVLNVLTRTSGGRP